MNTSKTCKSSHPLRPHTSDDVFVCDYCLEKGMGPRFSCAGCNYNLHRECAFTEPVKTHTFIRGIFTLSKQKTINVCSACGNAVQGFGYYCDATEHCLHPCCAYIPKKIESDEGWLFLDDKILSECELCDRDDPGWCYRTKTKDNYSHISCLKEELLKVVQDRIFSNSVKDRLEEVAYDEAKRSQKLKTERERASEAVILLRDNSYKAESSMKSNRKVNKKSKKSRGFWRWVGYAVAYVAASVGISFAPSPGRLLLEG